MQRFTMKEQLILHINVITQQEEACRSLHGTVGPSAGFHGVALWHKTGRRCFITCRHFLKTAVKLVVTEVLVRGKQLSDIFTYTQWIITDRRSSR